MKQCLLPVLVVVTLIALLLNACAQQGSAPSVEPSASVEPGESIPGADITTEQEEDQILPFESEPSEVNFRLLISDDQNDIADFEELHVTISSIGVHESGGAGTWHIFNLDPETDYDSDGVPGLNLTELVGENALQVWSSELSEGEYNKIFIYVGEVTEVPSAKEGDQDSIIKLPGGRLQISKPFTINASIVNFIYDITVVKAGQSGKYILKPQIAQSGSEIAFHEVELEDKGIPEETGGPGGNGQSEKGEKQGKERDLDLEIVGGEIAPGEIVTLYVTYDGEPVPDARVSINGEELIEHTVEDGTFDFIVPDSAEELEIEVEKGNLTGKLKIQLPVTAE